MPYRDDIDVALLIGLNCVSAIRPREVIVGNDNDPYAKRTALGWGIIKVYQTKAKPTDQRCNRTCHLMVGTDAREIITPQQINRMFGIDFNEREGDSKPLSQEDRHFLQIMETETHQRVDGHYEMPLPFKKEEAIFQNNRDLAVNRLKHLKKRLKSDQNYRKDYQDFMQNIISNGHAERVPENELAINDGHTWYVPHHGVYHPKKPGKIRVVFDCSAMYKGESLNKELLQGPDLTNNLIGVLCRFRKEPVASCAMSRKCFIKSRSQKATVTSCASCGGRMAISRKNRLNTE